METGLYTYPPDLESIYSMDVMRLDRLWSGLMKLTPNNVPCGSMGHDGNSETVDPLENFVKAVATIPNEGVVLRLLWSLDRCIERGYFTPQ